MHDIHVFASFNSRIVVLMGKFSFSFFVKRQSSRRIHGVESCQTHEWRKNKDNKTAKRSLYNSQTSERANETKEQYRMFLLCLVLNGWDRGCSMPYLMIFGTNMFCCLITILLFVINYPWFSQSSERSLWKEGKGKSEAGQDSCEA